MTILLDLKDIDRLRAEIKRLRAALEEITATERPATMREIARRALGVSEP